LKNYRAFMSGVKDKIKVLFLCTGNSCRSQIAQAWTNHLKSDLVEAYSAGIRPSAVNPRAVKVMAEEEIDISSQTSKHVDELLGIDFDYVVTLCDYARDNCPVFTGNAKLIHRVFEDPTLVISSEEKILAAFRKTRDNIKAFIQTLPECLERESA